MGRRSPGLASWPAPNAIICWRCRRALNLRSTARFRFRSQRVLRQICPSDRQAARVASVGPDLLPARRPHAAPPHAAATLQHLTSPQPRLRIFLHPSSARKNASLLGSLRAERLAPRRDRSGNTRRSWRRTQVNRVASRRQRRSQCYPPDWITGIVLRARAPNGTARAQRAPSLDGANLPSPAASGRGWRARQRAPGEGTIPEDARFRGPLTLPALRPFGRLRRVPPSPALAGEGRSTMRWAERSITEASAG